MAPIRPRDHSSPLTRAASSSSRTSPISSVVVIHGPMAVAKSLPLFGPRPTFMVSAWIARADQSLSRAVADDGGLGLVGRRAVDGLAQHRAQLQFEIHLRLPAGKWISASWPNMARWFER
jgi:hypothetical protein